MEQASSVRPLIAIVGRPNVGKSSLFNALIGRRTAIVSEVAGTTRDRLVDEVRFGHRSALLADTGGLVPEPETEMEASITAQVQVAVADADAILLVADAREGLTHADRHAAEQLRRSRKPVVLAANKVDHPNHEALALELYELGVGDPIPVSAQHRHGMDDVLEALFERIPAAEPVAPPPVPHFAIVGRPNVGKSALANAVLGVERAIVSGIAGTTRDALDTPFAYEGEPAVLIDTAGIRRRGSVEPGIERYSVLRAVRAIDRCDVALVVLDATEPAAAQDLHIAGRVRESFKGAVVVVNKWDLVEKSDRPERDERTFRHRILDRLRFLPGVPVVFTSAVRGQGIDAVLEAAFAVHERRSRWVPPEQLNEVILTAMAHHPPVSRTKGALKIYRVKQEAVAPPTFVFYCNAPDRVHFSYERYLENVLREAFGYEGVHLRLEFRGRGKLHVIGGHQAKRSPGADQHRRGHRERRGA